MEQSNRLASCLRSHSLISLARLSAKQRSASGPWLNAGSTPRIYQTTRYASTNGSGKRPKPFDFDFTATGVMSHAISKDDKGVLLVSSTYFSYTVTENVSQSWWNTTNQSMPVSSSLPLIEDQDLWVPNPSRVWSLWRWHHSTSVTLRRLKAQRGASWESPKTIRSAPSTYLKCPPSWREKKGRNLQKSILMTVPIIILPMDSPITRNSCSSGHTPRLFL